MIDLPVPDQEAIVSFQKLVQAQLGLELTMEEAKEASTSLLQLHFLLVFYFPESLESKAYFERLEQREKRSEDGT